METMNENPIVKLSELVQRIYGSSLQTEVLGKTGPDHCPTVKVKITLPNGKYEIATGGNQKEAKKLAAQRLLKNFR